MIETRYSIEYIDPNSGTMSSRLGKLLIYSVLAISIITVIIALIFSNLPRTTSQNITVKVQDFVSSFNTAATPSIINKQLAQQKINSSKREIALKEEIENLSQENTIQHNESIKQLKVNQTLKKKILLLSDQLKDEKLKHSQLTKEVVSLNRKNKSVSAQLDERIQAAKDYASEIKKLEHKKITTFKVTTPKIIATPEPLENKNPPIDSVSNKNKITIQKTAPKEKETSNSQIDAIVAAMEAANNTNTINTKLTTPKDNK